MFNLHSNDWMTRRTSMRQYHWSMTAGAPCIYTRENSLFSPSQRDPLRAECSSALFSRIQRAQSMGWKNSFLLCSFSIELGDLGRDLQAAVVKMDVEWFILSGKKVKEEKRNLQQVASRCIANGMLIDSTQKEIRDVNVFEKIIIQITTSSSDTSMIEY